MFQSFDLLAKQDRENAPAILLTNASRADLRSSMNPSSYMPSSLRKGICLFNALLGRGGTTIFEGFVR